MSEPLTGCGAGKSNLSPRFNHHGQATKIHKKDAETAFYLRLVNLANSSFPHGKTRSAPIGVKYTFLYIHHSVGSALFILGKQACESLTSGINDECLEPALFFLYNSKRKY